MIFTNLNIDLTLIDVKINLLMERTNKKLIPTQLLKIIYFVNPKPTLLLYLFIVVKLLPREE